MEYEGLVVMVPPAVPVRPGQDVYRAPRRDMDVLRGNGTIPRFRWGPLGAGGAHPTGAASPPERCARCQWYPGSLQDHQLRGIRAWHGYQGGRVLGQHLLTKHLGVDGISCAKKGWDDEPG